VRRIDLVFFLPDFANEQRLKFESHQIAFFQKRIDFALPSFRERQASLSREAPSPRIPLPAA
jgi:hypothetical protein